MRGSRAALAGSCARRPSPASVWRPSASRHRHSVSPKPQFSREEWDIGDTLRGVTGQPDARTQPSPRIRPPAPHSVAEIPLFARKLGRWGHYATARTHTPETTRRYDAFRPPHAHDPKG